MRREMLLKRLDVQSAAFGYAQSMASGRDDMQRAIAVQRSKIPIFERICIADIFDATTELLQLQRSRPVGAAAGEAAVKKVCYCACIK